MARHVAAALGALLVAGCAGGRTVDVVVPPGASFAAIADSLARRDVIDAPRLFRLYARLVGADRAVRPGVYRLPQRAWWPTVLAKLRRGEVLLARLVVPEGWTLDRLAPRLAAVTGAPLDSVRRVLRDPATARRFGVPGPTLEGYLYPATYIVPWRTPLADVLAPMVRRYRQVWTPARLARLQALGLSEREAVTLASIVEREAKIRAEMPRIAAVFWNRLRRGMPLQADPTVQYALGRHEPRLLYAHIREAAASPYNTYTRRGLPPGPIGAPSDAALDAVLWPAASDELYFVAGPDGRHRFSRTLAEHNALRRRLRDSLPPLR